MIKDYSIKHKELVMVLVMKMNMMHMINHYLMKNLKLIYIQE